MVNATGNLTTGTTMMGVVSSSALPGGGGGGYETVGVVPAGTDDPTRSPPPEERTVIGIPVRLMWVPYVGLGLILCCLMLASFLRYHRKHGHKYQQRRLELWKKFNMENLIDQIQEGVDTVGSMASGGSLPPNGGMNISPSTSSTQPDSAPQQQAPPPKPAGKKHRKPLCFTSNLNGSMVDIRCGGTRTFPPSNTAPMSTTVVSAAALKSSGKKNKSLKGGGGKKGKGAGPSSELLPPLLPLLPGPSPSQLKYKNKSSPVIWTLTRPRGRPGATKTPPSFFSSPMDIQPDEIEAEDDEVFLLQQTPL